MPSMPTAREIHSRLRAIDRASDDSAEFHVLHDPVRNGEPSPDLVIVIHPGDLVEPGFDRGALARQKGLAAELAARSGQDFLVLHRNSCSQFGTGRLPSVHPALKKALQDGWKRGVILHGDDLEAASAWIVSHMALDRRREIFLGGAYGDAEDGCLAFVGKAIEAAAPGRIVLSAHIPCPGGDPWTPGSALTEPGPCEP
ncbi:hypothetical protein LAZ40_06610 [Cereibacter sphaeroides]|uniref:hypothetical protein n=1 Tax=Cereibacter sphaeroides TaxID=1063 RepID=UPI001F3ADFDB|nr:hypothetical protein [Cereibacter sphaeroides]MCE6958717.1 hypothetical protein [Cereibacter sphaeroides]MCE6971205.1 hypothetical protein [Cereibacter sphaeroides]